jgi:C1A family cysteine protease
MGLPLWFLSYAMYLNASNYTHNDLSEMFERALPHYEFSQAHPGASFNEQALYVPHPPLKLRPSHNRRMLQNMHMVQIPEEYDLRESGGPLLCPVINQGHCNSCFAITVAEQLNYFAMKKDPSINYNTLLECTPDTLGCSGGLMENVYKWGGPYSDVHKSGCDALTGLLVKDYVVISDLNGGDVEPHLAAAVYQYGPIPVGIDSTGSRFLTYKSGVIEPEECNKNPNHAVVVVGYTPEYWIIKNSWGEHWGEGGYGRISRGHDTCGISSYASFATQVEH